MYEKVSHAFRQAGKILGKYLRSGDKVIAAVSGGPDSTCLLDILARFAEKAGVQIFVAHVNHGLRARAADRDEAFVEKLAQKYGFEYFVKRVKISKKSHVEEKARSVRREFFKELLEKLGAKYIVTAHTEDDQLETILFNFLRGSGPKGLAGMSVKKNGFLKPMLVVSKKEILEYLHRRNMKFCVDSTNKETKFTRNFLRNKILPELMKVNPSLRKTLLRNSAIFAGIDKWMSREAEQFSNVMVRPTFVLLGRTAAGRQARHDITFPLQNFLKLPLALQSAVIQKVFKLGSKSPYQLSQEKVNEILRMLKKRIGNKQIVCGKQGKFVLEKGMVRFTAGLG